MSKSHIFPAVAQCLFYYVPLAAPETNLYIGPNKSGGPDFCFTLGPKTWCQHDGWTDGTQCIAGPGIAYSGFHLKVSMSAFHLFAVKVLG